MDHLHKRYQKKSKTRKKLSKKKQEAAELESKIKANPTLKERLGSKKDRSTQSPVQLSVEAEKKLIKEKELAEANKLAAERKNLSLPGVEYKVITTAGGQVEYIVTNANNVIYSQQVNSQASLYNRQVQAEQEAIYASNALRRNPGYPVDALKAEIKSLSTQVTSSSRQSNSNRVTADYTFNGGGGTIPGTGTGTGTGEPANPYPATITASGVPAGATVKSVTINGLSHTFPDDIDIVLQSPTGTNVILMSDCGLTDDLVNINYTFSDAAALALNDNNLSPTGIYKPTNFGTGDNWPAPGPLTAPHLLPFQHLEAVRKMVHGVYLLLMMQVLTQAAGQVGV
jgi:hypothetical protein